MPSDEPKRQPGRPKGTTKPPEQKDSARIQARVPPDLKAAYLKAGATRWLKSKLAEEKQKQARI